MSKQILAKAMLVNLREGETPVFRLVPENSTKINCDQFLELVAKKAQSDIVQARYWFDAFASTLGTKLAENCAIDLGDLFAKLVVLGSLQSVGDKPTKEKNPARAARPAFDGSVHRQQWR